MMDMEGLDSCSICMDSYDENLRPRNLPCGHTFCTTCINNTIKEERIKCPHCKVPHNALNDSDFPVNFIAEAMISKFREAKLGIAINENKERSLSATGTQVEKRERQKGINDLKESLIRLTEAAKTTENELEKYRKFINNRVAKHRDLIPQITNILQINEDIIMELERTEQKLTKYSEEQELYQADISNAIYKLENTTESSDKLSACEELVKLRDAMAGWNLRCNLQITATVILKHSKEITRKTSAALCKFKEKVDVPDYSWSSANSNLSVIDRWGYMQYVFDHPEGLQAMLAPNSSCMEKWYLVCAVLERDGHVYTANIIPENGKTYLHHFKYKTPSDDVIPLQYHKLTQSLDMNNVVAFMDLAFDGNTKGRIHISLSPQTPLATQFWKLCTGEMGPCYVNTRFLQVLNKGHYSERVVAGDYENGDGSGGAPLFTGLENKSTVYPRRSEVGCIGAVEDQNDGPRSAQFVICTRTHTDPRNIIFGRVQERLDLVKAAIELDDIKKVQIEECGIVLPF